jgi:hypothetical protein
VAEAHDCRDNSTGDEGHRRHDAQEVGTSVSLKLSGVRGPLTCRLVAVGKDGSQQTASNWSVGKEGYGTSAQPTSHRDG